MLKLDIVATHSSIKVKIIKKVEKVNLKIEITLPQRPTIGIHNLNPVQCIYIA